MFYLFVLCSAIKLKPKEGETYFDVVAVIDPVTREAQRLAPLLLVGTTAEAVPMFCPHDRYFRVWFWLCTRAVISRDLPNADFIVFIIFVFFLEIHFSEEKM